MQGTPLAALRRWWIVCSCFRSPWLAGWSSRWHHHHVWFLSFYRLGSLLFWCICICVWITPLCLWFASCSKAKDTMSQEMTASMIQRWQWRIIHASYSLLREIDCAGISGESQIMPPLFGMIIHKNPAISQRLFVIPMLVRRHSQVHPTFSLALWPVPKLITITPMLLLYHSSEIPLTMKAGRNALLRSDTLLKLTLLSLYSTSSQTLLEASSD